jgi:hypothetical protein
MPMTTCCKSSCSNISLSSHPKRPIGISSSASSTSEPGSETDANAGGGLPDSRSLSFRILARRFTTTYLAAPPTLLLSKRVPKMGVNACTDIVLVDDEYTVSSKLKSSGMT